MNFLRDRLQRAQQSHQAIGHFNISDLVALKAVFEAAKELNVPVIVKLRTKAAIWRVPTKSRSPSDRPVLFDRGTGSSGEAVAISFTGRTRERSFGDHTAGFSTSNGTYQLPDGGVLFLCNAIEADRSGKLYPDGLDPDERVPEPATHFSEENDAVLKAAEEWLAKQAGGTN
jgi:C-terminal processing protease CtpA/Prc